MGSLSYGVRENLSLFTSMYYKAKCSGYQENSEIREIIPHEIEHLNLFEHPKLLSSEILRVLQNYEVPEGDRREFCSDYDAGLSVLSGHF